MATFSTSLKLALGYEKATVEATKATIATGSYGAALWTTLWPIAAAATAIGILIAAFSKLSEAVENASPEGQLKKLEEEAEKSTEAFNNVNDAIENTNSVLKKLDDASATIQNLTTATTDWYKAISEVNAEVMKLTEQYAGLSKYITLDEKGMMSISQEGKDWLDTENRSRLTAANNQMLADQIAVDE
jgi:septal ring factor EnvC (AmiA/AmiB activator)